METGQYLGMFIAEEEYGIAILRVKEILQFEAITRVPGTRPRSAGSSTCAAALCP